MGFVVIGREGGGEEAAGAVADVVEEAGFLSPAAPVGGDADAAAVGEAEGRDVDGVGGGMLAPRALGAAVEAAAAVAAIMVDRRDPGAETAEGGGLDEMPFPQRQSGGD